MLKNFHYSIATLFLCTLMALTSCSKKDVKTEEENLATEELTDNSADKGQAAQTGTDTSTSTLDTNIPAPPTSGELQTVYFEFDRFDLTPSARNTLKSNADWLKANSSVTIEIQGHCDERGTIEYNLALGEKRANSVKSYLSKIGVPTSKMDTVSFGEEHPAVLGSNEDAWAKNRRAEFRITSK